jgi:hypothetical protein
LRLDETVSRHPQVNPEELVSDVAVPAVQLDLIADLFRLLSTGNAENRGTTSASG